MNGSACPLCQGRGTIVVREAGEVEGEAGDRQMRAVRTVQMPCPMGCKAPSALVGREMAMGELRSRVRVKAGRRPVPEERDDDYGFEGNEDEERTAAEALAALRRFYRF